VQSWVRIEDLNMTIVSLQVLLLFSQLYLFSNYINLVCVFYNFFTKKLTY